jgi:hypothetical protein
MPMMIFALVGVGAITIPAALKLLAWENEIDSDSFEWDRVQLIVADRKRSLVVLQRRYHPDIPFEQNYMYFKAFLPKQRFDDFIEACKQYAPSTVDFEEGALDISMLVRIFWGAMDGGGMVVSYLSKCRFWIAICRS